MEEEIAFIGFLEEEKIYKPLFYTLSKEDKINGFCILPNGRRVQFTNNPSYTEYESTPNPPPPPKQALQ